MPKKRRRSRRDRRPRQRPLLVGEARQRDKMLGALGVVAGFCERLDIAGIVDRLCPIRDVATLSCGQVIEALVANRLTSPRPMYRVQDWSRDWAVEEIFGTPPGALGDDKIGRSLDAIAEHLDEITGSVGAKAIEAFGLDVSRLHWDMTSISVYGAYADADEDHIEPRYGHPKDRRPDLKQVQTGLAVAGDGGVPIYHRGYDGGAGEVAQVVPAMQALRKIARRRRFLLIGDTKLVSYPNVAALIEAGVTFIAPASKSYVPAEVLAACDYDTAAAVDYVAERDRDKPAEQRATYRLKEDTMMIGTKRKADPELELRRIFVWSSARDHAAKTNRQKKLDRARDDLERLTRGLGGRHYPDTDAVTARTNAIAAQRRVKAYLHTDVGSDETGKPTLAWHFDSDALDTEAQGDGWYALLTNLDPADADAADVFHRYKGQEVVERRYSDFKGPLAVSPFFLKTNKRIQALITVICLALLIFCLIERQVRKAIEPNTTMVGLHPDSLGRKAKPTGRLIFYNLAKLRLIPASGSDPPTIPQPADICAILLDHLDIKPDQTRW